jgi:hypothetical protein
VAAGRGVSVSVGAHCRYCPAYKRCPAQLSLLREIPEQLYAIGVRPNEAPTETTPAALVVERGSLTVANAVRVWSMIEQIETVLASAKQEICSLAAVEPIDLPDGRVIGLLETSREKLDGKIAADLIEQWYGREARDATVTVAVSKDALREVVVKHKQPGDKIETKAKTGVFDRALEELRRRGGVEMSTTAMVKPHVPKRRRKQLR